MWQTCSDVVVVGHVDIEDQLALDRPEHCVLECLSVLWLDSVHCANVNLHRHQLNELLLQLFGRRVRLEAKVSVVAQRERELSIRKVTALD